MKTNSIIAGLAACALATVFVGCDKKPETGVSTTTNQVEKAADAVADKAKEVGHDIKEGAKDAATAVKEGAEKAGNEVKDAFTSDAQTLIDKAKSYVSEKKYQDALDTLAKLKDMKLTPEQQQVVDDLKVQVQKLMSSDASKAASGMLGK